MENRVKLLVLSAVAVLVLGACGEETKPQLPPMPDSRTQLPINSDVNQAAPTMSPSTDVPPKVSDDTPKVAPAPVEDQQAQEALQPAPQNEVPVAPQPIVLSPTEEILALQKLDIIELHKTALQYAMYDERGLQLSREAAIDFANQIVSYGRRIGPRVLVTHKIAFASAYNDAEGLTMPLRDAHCFADKVAHQECGLEKLMKFKRAFHYAYYDAQGLQLVRRDAVGYALRVSGLNLR